ncbi:MAG TPA: penicillin acylase family protein [Pyrinomonadaceae bacterium]|nr:penicillin acylase family protein [Pyrinomonadaceae bacterium]
MRRVFLLSLATAALAWCVLTPAAKVSSQSAAVATRSLQVAGLRAPVTVRRDERGIPYIEAANDEDLYFAQGYVTASDRLWQMDLQRRTARGELSEIFGQATLAQDKLHRTFGFGRIIDQAAANLDPEFNIAVTSYAKGVNAFIESLTEQTTPPEFRILRYKPRPWSPGDSLAVGALMAEYLSTTWQLDVMRGSLAALPKEKRDALLPETSPLDVLVVGTDRRRAQGSRPMSVPPAVAGGSARRRISPTVMEGVSPELLAELQKLNEAQQRSFDLLGLTPPALETIHASNNWVVSGKRSATGKPLLANDPHIPASAPGVWYQTQLIAPGVRVAGVTFPGLPGIVAGHNERIAWGVTNLGPDVQDVYLEKFDKTNPTKYQTPAGLRDAEVRQEQIKVRKGFGTAETDTQTVEVTVTRHGPIILEKDGTRYALRWSLLDPATLQTAGIFNVNRARNWKDFTAALSSYRGPTQNFVYADIDGHIGYYGAGWIPIRKSGDGSVPYDGATDDGEWTGFIPFENLPHLYDPPSGMIVTANQRVVGSSYPYFVSHAWASPYRARRIFDLLSAKSKLTTEDFRKIQGDVYSIAGKTFAQHAAKSLRSAGFQPASFISDLESWDGMMSADSRMAVIVSQMRPAFRARILNAALGPELAKGYGWPESEVLVDRIAGEQPGEWLPKEFSTYAELFKASYEDARQALTKSLGADESKWSWGAQTKARFTHPLAAAPLIGAQFTIAPIPQNGSGGTVNVGSAVSMRLIADLSDWDKSQHGIPLGQSGLPNSPHWKDQLDDWRNVTPRAFPFSRAAILGATKEIVLLTPAR